MSETPELVAESGIDFDERGDHELKGTLAPGRLYRVRTAQRPAAPVSAGRPMQSEGAARFQG